MKTAAVDEAVTMGAGHMGIDLRYNYLAVFTAERATSTDKPREQ